MLQQPSVLFFWNRAKRPGCRLSKSPPSRQNSRPATAGRNLGAHPIAPPTRPNSDLSKAMSEKNRVHCSDCTHFRAAPHQSRISGCFKDTNMTNRQKEACLDEQQIPGDHEKLNLRGDCSEFEAKPVKASLWKRLLAS